MCNPDGSRYCVWAYIYAALTTFTGTPLYAFLDVLKKNKTQKKIFHALQSLSLSLFPPPTGGVSVHRSTRRSHATHRFTNFNVITVGPVCLVVIRAAAKV